MLFSLNNSYTPSLQERRTKGQSITMVLDTKKSNFWSEEWLWFHTCFIMALYYKIQYVILQNARAILLQIAKKFITKCVRFFYKMRQFYYKMRQLIQNASILLQTATVITAVMTFITKCVSTITLNRRTKLD